MNLELEENVKLRQIVLLPMFVLNGDGVSGQKSMAKMAQVKDQVHLAGVERGSAKRVPTVRRVFLIAQN